MQRFIALLQELERADEETTLRVLTAYFRDLPDDDGAWAIWLLFGNRPKRLITNAELRESVIIETELPAWLVDDSCDAVDEPCESFALLLDTAGISSEEGAPWSLATFLGKTVSRVADDNPTEKRKAFGEIWPRLSLPECLFFHELITDAFRISVPRRLVVQAVSTRAQVPEPIIALRLRNGVRPEPECFRSLLAEASTDEKQCHPYPFGTNDVVPVETGPPGPIDDWQIECIRDGIRAQIIRRGDHTLIWTESMDLISDSCSEINEAARLLPSGTVVEGTIVAMLNNRPQPLAPSGEGGARKNSRLTTMLFVVSDILEQDGSDLRDHSVTRRREILCELFADWQKRLRKSSRGPLVQGDLFVAPDAEVSLPARLGDLLNPKDWNELRSQVTNARNWGAEGFLLKRRSATSLNKSGTTNCLLWLAPPFRLTVVLTASRQFDDGSPSEYVFSVWNKETLVTVTKATSGFTKEESADLRKFVREHTIERHGPVRSVAAELVFGLVFDGVHESSRHKSGLSLRNPRITGWKKDIPAQEAGTLAELTKLIPDLT
jgi:DNA ligase 1